MRLLPVAVLLLFSSAASAAPVLFDNRADFNAAVGASQLFSDFPATYIPGTFDFEGNYGGLYVRQEATEFLFGETLGARGQYESGRAGFLGFATIPIRAVGFDVVSATRWTGRVQTGGEFPEIVPTTLSFGFLTTGGEFVSRSVAPGSFFGALLYDDDFRFVSFSTSAECFCHTSFEIDNLAVAAVPEPTTAILLGLGLLGIAAARRRLAATR